MAMSTTTRPPSLARRKSQVYVDVPPSPYQISRPASRGGPSGSPLTPSVSSLKENTPLRPTRTNSDSTTMTSLSSLSSRANKRKLSEDTDTENGTDGRQDTMNSKSKKPKLSTSAAPVSDKPKSIVEVVMKPRTKPAKITNESNDPKEFSDGYFYCHQCNKKRDISQEIQCTLKDSKSKIQNQRCKTKYCKACLKNRYEEDLDTIKSRNVAELSKKQREKHVSGQGYYYECPRCRDECNCRNCRKAKGLEPTGNLKLLVRNAEVDATTLLKDPKATHVAIDKHAKALAAKKEKTEKAKESRAQKLIPKTKAASSSSKPAARAPKAVTKMGPKSRVASTSKPIVKPAPKPKPVPKPKPIPKPVWTRLSVPLSLAHAEARIHIREFILRFASALQVANSHVEELEELAGESLGEPEHWEDEDDMEVVGWVSEACLRAIVLGLLDAIEGAAEASKAHNEAKAIKECIKTVRASGANLNKIWAALNSLRDSLYSRWSAYTMNLADPIPPPSTTTYRSTRSSGAQGKNGEPSIHIACTAQLVPVIVDLLEYAIESPTIREAIDAGLVDEKELNREFKEATTKENASWKDTKETQKAKDKADMKANRERHQRLLQDLENAHRVLSYHHVPRFAPLGRDTDGRIYYAMTPGMAERDAAEQLLAGKHDVRVKFGRKRGGLTKEDRKEMQRWSWFIGIWGRKPEGAEEARQDQDDDEDMDKDTDENVESWWGFWDPKEIKKLAEWLAMKHNLGGNDSQTRKRTSSSPANSLLDSTGSSNKGKEIERGRSPAASSAWSTSSLSNSREPSPLSDLSDEEDEEEHETSDMMIDSEGRPVPSRRELRALVKGLKEYADLLEWRARRAAAAAEESVEKQAKEPRTTGAIPAAQFYA